MEPPEDRDGGGDPACWLNLVCPRCGELGGHRPDCPAATPAIDLEEAGEAAPAGVDPPDPAPDPRGDR